MQEKILRTKLEIETAACSTDKFRERFFARTELQADGCLIWLGATTDSGYGLTRLGSTAKVAHRVAWFLHHGVWPPAWPQSGMVLDHTCSVKLCVNAEHLRLVTTEENMAKPKPRRKKVIKHCACCPNHNKN